MFKSKILICAALLGLAFASPSNARTNTPLLGGFGGGPFKDICKGGRYLTGFFYYSGTALDQVTPLCHRADSKGRWKGDEVDGESFGGFGGRGGWVRCQEDQYVTSLHVWWDSLGHVQRIRINCHSFDRDDKSKETTRNSGGGFASHEAGTSCPIGEFAVGVRGRHGSLIDRIGLVCEEPNN